MKNLILAALLALSPATGMQDSLATAAAATVSMEAAQEDLTVEAQAIEAALKAQAQAPVLSEPFEVVITFYVPSRRNGSLTASGAYAKTGTIAADASVPFGTQYYLPGFTFIKSDGLFTVQDRGSAVYGNVVDIFLPSTAPTDAATKTALQAGRIKAIAYRVLTGEEAAQKKALLSAVASSTEVAAQRQTMVPDSATTLHNGDSTAPVSSPDSGLPLDPLDQNTVPIENLSNPLQVQRRSRSN